MSSKCYTYEELKELILDQSNSIDYIVICGGNAYDDTIIINHLSGLGIISRPNACNFEEVKRSIEDKLEFINTVLRTSFQSACEVIQNLDLDLDGVPDSSVIGRFVDVRQSFNYWIDVLGNKCAKYNTGVSTG